MRIIEKHKTFIETEAGFGTIDEAITDGIKISKRYSLPVLFSFNGINMKCDENCILEDIKKEFRLIQDANRIDHQNSKQYFLSQEEYNSKNEKEQKELDNNLKDYYNLNFKSHKDVLLWFKDNLYYLDNCNVSFDKQELLQPLFEAGYYPNMHTGDKFDGTFESKEFWIIGQIMSCFHPLFVDKIKDLYKIKD